MRRRPGETIRRHWAAGFALAIAALVSGSVWVGAQDASMVLSEEERALEQKRIRREIELLQQYRFGTYRGHWNAVEAKMRDQYQRNRDTAEQMLALVVAMRASSRDARILACRGLRWVGKGNADPKAGSSIDLLASLVRDPKLSAEACAALQERKVRPSMWPCVKLCLWRSPAPGRPSSSRWRVGVMSKR